MSIGVADAFIQSDWQLLYTSEFTHLWTNQGKVSCSRTHWQMCHGGNQTRVPHTKGMGLIHCVIATLDHNIGSAYSTDSQNWFWKWKLPWHITQKGLWFVHLYHFLLYLNYVHLCQVNPLLLLLFPLSYSAKPQRIDVVHLLFILLLLFIFSLALCVNPPFSSQLSSFS